MYGARGRAVVGESGKVANEQGSAGSAPVAWISNGKGNISHIYKIKWSRERIPGGGVRSTRE